MLHGFRLHSIYKGRRDSHQDFGYANKHDGSPEDDGTCVQVLLYDSLLVSPPHPSTPCPMSLTIPSSYYYYFYTYIYNIEVTTITSTFTTTTTTLSIYAANSRTASARLSSLGSSVRENDFTTPAAATTALNFTPARATASGASSSGGSIQDDGTDDTDENDGPSLPGVGGPGLGAGDLPGAGTQMGIVPGWAVAWALGAGVVAWGMVWL